MTVIAKIQIFSTKCFMEKGYGNSAISQRLALEHLYSIG